MTQSQADRLVATHELLAEIGVVPTRLDSDAGVTVVQWVTEGVLCGVALADGTDVDASHAAVFGPLLLPSCFVIAGGTAGTAGNIWLWHRIDDIWVTKAVAFWPRRWWKSAWSPLGGLIEGLQHEIPVLIAGNVTPVEGTPPEWAFAAAEVFNG